MNEGYSSFESVSDWRSCFLSLRFIPLLFWEKPNGRTRMEQPMGNGTISHKDHHASWFVVHRHVGHASAGYFVNTLSWTRKNWLLQRNPSGSCLQRALLSLFQSRICQVVYTWCQVADDTIRKIEILYEEMKLLEGKHRVPMYFVITFSNSLLIDAILNRVISCWTMSS